MHSDPLGYFLTWVTYGTWLPGDARGWVEYHHGWQLPDPVLELESNALMTEDACRLNGGQRIAVERQLVETCEIRGWQLWASICRSNHVHVVVSAPSTPPKKIRSDLKAWSTRRLKEDFGLARRNWWAERGSIRYLNDEASIEAAVRYIQEAQDRKDRDIPTRSVSEGVSEGAINLGVPSLTLRVGNRSTK